MDLPDKVKCPSYYQLPYSFLAIITGVVFPFNLGDHVIWVCLPNQCVSSMRAKLIVGFVHHCLLSAWHKAWTHSGHWKILAE